MPASRLARYGLRPSRLCYLAATALVLATFSWPVFASTDADLCDQAAMVAAKKHGVPLDVLRIVALLETGRKQDGRWQPWPWALNAGGQSHWLPSKARAKETAQSILATGRRNVDFGCFQLNYHWHGRHFNSLDAMLDPAQNADYAARYLLSHYRRLGDWKAAVGAYHSRTPKHAQRYLTRYEAIARALTPLGPASPPQAQPSPSTRRNGYALLTGTGSGTRGSLVPASTLSASAPLLPLMERAK